mgnify:CR=1 FL=1
MTMAHYYPANRPAHTLDVPCWFSPESTNVTDIGRIVTPAHYWTQVEPNGPHASAPDMDTLRSKCEALVDHSVLLELQNPEEVK